jgi:DNA replication protein DnaC
MRQLSLDKLSELSLKGMRAALERQLQDPASREMDFEERLLMLLDAEELHRKERSLSYRLQAAGLRQNTRLEELDFKAGRSFDRTLLKELQTCRWIKQRRNLVLTGPTGIGKTFLACALAHAACQDRCSARYFRLPRLLGELSLARAQGTQKTKLASIGAVDLVIFDDWLLSPITLSEARDVLEILDDRYDRRSTLICTQIPIDQWHGLIPEPTLADAILDRLVHNAYRLQMDGESMRKAKGLAVEGTLDPSTNP